MSAPRKLCLPAPGLSHCWRSTCPGPCCLFQFIVAQASAIAGGELAQVPACVHPGLLHRWRRTCHASICLYVCPSEETHASCWSPRCSIGPVGWSRHPTSHSTSEPVMASVCRQRQVAMRPSSSYVPCPRYRPGAGGQTHISTFSPPWSRGHLLSSAPGWWPLVVAGHGSKLAQSASTH